MAPFTARSHLSASSILTTLDDRACRGYVAILQVEKTVAVHLCPQNASTWRNRLCLPSKACKLTAALAVKAYSAVGQAASALQATAMLQVHQVKALKQMRGMAYWRHGLHCPTHLAGSRVQFDSATQFSSPDNLQSSALFSRLRWQPGMLLSFREEISVLLAKEAIRAGPSSRDEAGVLQPLLHHTQERQWPSANPESANLESGPKQSPSSRC